MICSYSKPVIRLIDMNYNIGKKLLSERFYLTWAGEEMSWTVRMTLKMRDELDCPHDTEDAGCR